MDRTYISIVLADDHQIIRASWKALLENDPRFRVVADCHNGEKVIDYVRSLHPDILLVDITLSPNNGFSVARRVAEEFPSVGVIGLSVNNQPKYAIKMVGLGARGYLTKTSPLEEIIHGITEVHKGHTFICEEVKRHMPAH